MPTGVEVVQRVYKASRFFKKNPIGFGAVLIRPELLLDRLPSQAMHLERGLGNRLRPSSCLPYLENSEVPTATQTWAPGGPWVTREERGSK